jgi:predicted transcriptional regulator
MKNRKEVQVAVQTVIKDAPFTLHDLAEEAGISYDSLRSWSVERRAPRPKSVQKLARGLRSKAAELLALADKLDAP